MTVESFVQYFRSSPVRSIILYVCHHSHRATLMSIHGLELLAVFSLVFLFFFCWLNISLMVFYIVSASDTVSVQSLKDFKDDSAFLRLWLKLTHR